MKLHLPYSPALSIVPSHCAFTGNTGCGPQRQHAVQARSAAWRVFAQDSCWLFHRWMWVLGRLIFFSKLQQKSWKFTFNAMDHRHLIFHRLTQLVSPGGKSLSCRRIGPAASLPPGAEDKICRAERMGCGTFEGLNELIGCRNKKLLGAPGLTTRSKDATRGSWHRC